MAKLGVITDGISRDLEHALQVATEHDLEYAELQFVWDKEVGDLDDDQMASALALVDKSASKCHRSRGTTLLVCWSARSRSATPSTRNTWPPCSVASTWPRPSTLRLFGP